MNSKKKQEDRLDPRTGEVCCSAECRCDLDPKCTCPCCMVSVSKPSKGTITDVTCKCSIHSDGSITCPKHYPAQNTNTWEERIDNMSTDPQGILHLSKHGLKDFISKLLEDQTEKAYQKGYEVAEEWYKDELDLQRKQTIESIEAYKAILEKERLMNLSQGLDIGHVNHAIGAVRNILTELQKGNYDR